MGWYLDYQMEKWKQEDEEAFEKMKWEMIDKKNIATAYELGTIDEDQYLNLLREGSMNFKRQFRRKGERLEKGSLQEMEVKKAMEVLKKAVGDLFKGKVDRRIKKKAA